MPRDLTNLERMAMDALHYGINWRLDGEPCWCACERKSAWKSGKKIHTRFCRTASAAYAEFEKEAAMWLGEKPKRTARA